MHKIVIDVDYFGRADTISSSSVWDKTPTKGLTDYLFYHIHYELLYPVLEKRDLCVKPIKQHLLLWRGRQYA